MPFVAMTALRTNKADAARRQLDASIRMLFAGEDVLAVHTVAAAANRILRDLAERSDKSSFHKIIKQTIRPGMEKEFWSMFNTSANFLKHADADPDAILDVEEEANDIMIAISCSYYESLGFQLTSDMRGFLTWYIVMHPNVLVDTAPGKAVLAGQTFDEVRSQPRPKQLQHGRIFCDLVKNQKSGF